MGQQFPVFLSRCLLSTCAAVISDAFSKNVPIGIFWYCFLLTGTHSGSFRPNFFSRAIASTLTATARSQEAMPLDLNSVTCVSSVLPVALPSTTSASLFTVDHALHLRQKP